MEEEEDCDSSSSPLFLLLMYRVFNQGRLRRGERLPICVSWKMSHAASEERLGLEESRRETGGGGCKTNCQHGNIYPSIWEEDDFSCFPYNSRGPRFLSPVIVSPSLVPPRIGRIEIKQISGAEEG